MVVGASVAWYSEVVNEKQSRTPGRELAGSSGTVGRYLRELLARIPADVPTDQGDCPRQLRTKTQWASVLSARRPFSLDVVPSRCLWTVLTECGLLASFGEVFSRAAESVYVTDNRTYTASRVRMRASLRPRVRYSGVCSRSRRQSGGLRDGRVDVTP
jgi:hypothetical protein